MLKKIIDQTFGIYDLRGRGKEMTYHWYLLVPIQKYFPQLL